MKTLHHRALERFAGVLGSLVGPICVAIAGAKLCGGQGLVEWAWFVLGMLGAGLTIGMRHEDEAIPTKHTHVHEHVGSLKVDGIDELREVLRTPIEIAPVSVELPPVVVDHRDAEPPPWVEAPAAPMASAPATPPPRAATPTPQPFIEPDVRAEALVSALTNMGFSKASARAKTKHVIAEAPPNDPMENLLVSALRFKEDA